MTKKLKRIRQCKKCPWKTSTNPRDIPHGYSVEAHRALARTIADPGSVPDIYAPLHVMACHEHPSRDKVYCVGWLLHQLGPGNNIALRLAMLDCENLSEVVLDGPQHERFEDTLPHDAVSD